MVWINELICHQAFVKINSKNTVMTCQHKGMYSIKLILARQASLINQCKNIKYKV